MVDGERREVVVLHTGGTLGMVARGDGAFEPRAGALAEALAGLPELHDARLPRVRLEEFEPLLDSSDMRPSDWQRIAERTAAAFAGEAGNPPAAGVVVLHGTDTMAYSASALAFLLENLPGPVVMTGSQLPLVALRSDGRDNLITSLLLAATPGWAEVGVYVGGALLRGCRTTKVSTHGFDAFASPNAAPLAEVGVDVAWNRALVRPPQVGGVRVRPLAGVEVIALRLFPGIGAETLRNVLRDPVRGVVLETYGSGNAPSRDAALLAALRAATERGVVMVNVTQCLRGAVRMGDYATGRALQEVGVVGGGDMTAEAALAKLQVLLASGAPAAAVAQAMAQDLAGELSPTP
jgi:L-asparaginase